MDREPSAICVVAPPGEDHEACLRSVEQHTPDGVRIVVAGSASDVAAPHSADLVVVDGRHRVGPGWLEGLQRAAHSDATIATASALTTWTGPTAIGADADADAVEAVRRRARGGLPRLDAPAGACVYIRREALDLAGPLDDGFGARCTAVGLLHVAADDVLVTGGAAPAGAEPEEEAMESIAARRAAQRPLERSLAIARRAAAGLSVTVDGRVLTGAATGTHVHALELIAALHRTGALRLRVVVPPDPGAAELAALEALEGVELLAATDVGPATRPTTIAHRPYQVSDVHDLLQLRATGERVVLTHLDLLNYHNPAYHRRAEDWQAHRRLTREALGAADAVVTLSQHTASDLRREDLVAPERLHVVPAGTDHVVRPAGGAAERPAGLDPLDGRPFLFCLGTDLRHKNRPFALDLLAALRQRGWDGGLVLAGPHVDPGSSREQERTRLAAGDLDGTVADLGPVGEAAKAWLYREAAAVVYPTTYEGFGFIPFEAAVAGTPSLFAARSSLTDALPEATAVLVPWDADASAERALALLSDPAATERQVAAIRAAAARLTWDGAAAALVDIYERTLAEPAPEAATLAWVAMQAEEQRGQEEVRYWQLFTTIGPAGHVLVGERGMLPEDGRRVLAGLLRRPVTRRPTLALLRALGRMPGRTSGP